MEPNVFISAAEITTIEIPHTDVPAYGIDIKMRSTEGPRDRLSGTWDADEARRMALYILSITDPGAVLVQPEDMVLRVTADESEWGSATWTAISGDHGVTAKLYQGRPTVAQILNDFYPPSPYSADEIAGGS